MGMSAPKGTHSPYNGPATLKLTMCVRFCANLPALVLSSLSRLSVTTWQSCPIKRGSRVDVTIVLPSAAF